MANREYKVEKVATRVEDDTEIELWTKPYGDQQLVMVLGKKALELAEFHRNGVPEPEGLREPHVLAQYHADLRKLVTFPCSTKPNRYVFEPKYNFESVTFENQQPLHLDADTIIVHGLPSGFEPNPLDGFGLYYPLRFIFEVFEQVPGVEDITMCDDEYMSFKDGVVRFPIFKYHVVRTAINRAHRAALDFANDEKNSYLRSEILPEIMPEDQIQGSFQRSAYDLDRVLKAALSGTTRLKRPNENAIAAVRTIRSAAKSVVRESRAEILELNREIELVTLESLIGLLEEKLDKSLAESYWQKLLLRNPFILKLAFGLPVAIFGEQVSVGGADFKGKGGKLADFLVDAGLLGNLAVIEIKRPSTKLLQAKPYREGIFAPSREIVGSVNQVLDQRFQLQQSINDKKIQSKTYDVFAFAVQCIVIVGRVPDDEDQRKSFELFRNNLRDVLVITFDELLQKLKALYEFLQANPIEGASALDPLTPDVEDDEATFDDVDYEEDEHFEDFLGLDANDDEQKQTKQRST